MNKTTTIVIKRETQEYNVNTDPSFENHLSIDLFTKEFNQIPIGEIEETNGEIKYILEFDKMEEFLDTANYRNSVLSPDLYNVLVETFNNIKENIN